MYQQYIDVESDSDDPPAVNAVMATHERHQERHKGADSQRRDRGSHWNSAGGSGGRPKDEDYGGGPGSKETRYWSIKPGEDTRYYGRREDDGRSVD